MQYSIALLSVIATALANNVDVATVLLADVQSNLDEYISLVGGTIPIPTELIAYYTEIATYTDDSYTTLLSDFPADQISTIVTQLPWYSSRLESKLAVAYTEGESSSAAASSSSPISSSSLVSPTSSSVISSASASSEVSSSVPSVSSQTSTVSSTAEVETYTGGAANVNQYLPFILASPLISFLI